jgi:hypothetical protein
VRVWKTLLDIIPLKEYNIIMWEVEYTDEFEDWRSSLNDAEREAVAFSVGILEQVGPSLKYPHSSSVEQSKHKKMRELRSQCEGRPLRTLYVFDPRRVAILLIGGDKTGDDRFYDVIVPKADKIYDNYLQETGE